MNKLSSFLRRWWQKHPNADYHARVQGALVLQALRDGFYQEFGDWDRDVLDARWAQIEENALGVSKNT